MKTAVTPKLTLNKETIRRLADCELQNVVGGLAPQRVSNPCQTGNTSCCPTTQTTITVTISFDLTCTQA